MTTGFVRVFVNLFGNSFEPNGDICNAIDMPILVAISFQIQSKSEVRRRSHQEGRQGSTGGGLEDALILILARFAHRCPLCKILIIELKMKKKKCLKIFLQYLIQREGCQKELSIGFCSFATPGDVIHIN